MASKAAEWAERYKIADRARETVRCERPRSVALKLVSHRAIEVSLNEYGEPVLTVPVLISNELVDLKQTFGDDAKETAS